MFQSKICIGLSGLTLADNIIVLSSEFLLVLLATVQLYNVLVLMFLDMKQFSFANVSIPV